MTITITNGKGGVGKTTIALLLAATLQDAGKSVSVDDRDPQQSATTLADRLNVPLGTSGEFVLIDTAPRLDHGPTLTAISEGDICLVVTTPNPADLATTQRTADLVKIRRGSRKTRIILNSLRRGTKLGDAAEEVVSILPFPAIAQLARREAYALAMLHGWPALHSDAREELQKLAIAVLTA
ncbi:MAG: ParA family protein [Chthoniobacterales bacterium]